MSFTTRCFFLLYFLALPCLSFSQKKKLDSLLSLLPVKMHDTARVLLLVDISREYVYSDDKKAEEYAMQAGDLAEKIAFPRGIALVRRNEGVIAYYRGKYRESVSIYEDALNLARWAHDSTLAVQLTRAIGISYDKLGDHINARDKFNKALVGFKALNDSGGMAACYASIGVTYTQASAWEKALEFYLQSLRMREGRKGEERNIGDLLNNIGHVHKAMGDNSKALDFYFRSVNVREQYSDPRGLSISFSSISSLYLSLDSLDDAEKYSLKALELAEKIRFLDVITSCYSQIGTVWAKRKNYPKAYSNHLQALQLNVQSGDLDGVIASCISLADLSILTNDLTKAKQYYMMARDSSRKYDRKEELAKCYTGLAEVLYKTGQHREAYENMLLAYAWQDSISKQSNMQAMAEMQTLYETEKKEKEIELQAQKLKATNSDLERQRTLQYVYISGIVLLSLLAFFVFRSFRQKQKSERSLAEKNRIIEEKSDALEQKNKDVTDSINYALRIQQAILPGEETREGLFPDSFILFRPKDIVSGDFYWYAEKNGRKLIAAVDCTGHGVPGAFMSMIGTAFLNEIVNEKGIVQPAHILDELRNRVKGSLKQTGAEGETRDGMDIALVSYDERTQVLEFAGANNPLWICRNVVRVRMMEEVQPDKRPIGYFKGKGLAFTLQRVELAKGDAFYIFTDGFADQFGGPKGKKFKYRALQEKLIELSGLPAGEQKVQLDLLFTEWKGNLEQVDDVLVIGIKI